MILPFLLLSFLFWSCRPLSEETIQINLPAYPQHLPVFPEEALWTLEAYSEGNQIKMLELPYRGEASLSLHITKETPLLCLLYPPFMNNYYAPCPAGGLHESGESSVLNLSWPGGAGVSFLIDVAKAGMPLSTINLRRLSDTIREKGDPNPWILDWDLLGRQMVAREMRSWYIRKKYLYALDILFPAGCWLPGAAWLDPLVLDVSETLKLELCEGIHSYLNLNSGDVFIIAVDDRGEVFTLLHPQKKGATIQDRG
ncbi:MAG: hypothetical protein B6241_00475 [Spirochaetaceae bacterium 4572_59]|nr:MAG: hypothetical protein B6241_00475 [Spirochaetaceae bacterium 4572_59]